MSADRNSTSRQRLTRDEVVDAAEAVIDELGWDRLTMAALAAELGVKAPSLYHHVEGIDALRFEVQRRTYIALGEALSAAAMDSPPTADSLRPLCVAHREFAHQFPQRYECVGRPQIGTGPMPDLGLLVTRDLFNEIGVPAEVCDSMIIAMFVAQYGFITLELSGFFSPEIDVEAIFHTLIDDAVRTVAQAARNDRPG